MNLDRYVWQEHAACRGIEAELFFPISEEEAGPAKAICDTCDVETDCLLFSLQNRERYGVWGGVTEKERIDMVRRGVAQRVLAESLRSAV
jgi:WhiB family redox-sensing transcriptional regulator